MDVKHERESYEIAQRIVGFANGVNQYYPESRYLHSSIIEKRWNGVKSYLEHRNNTKVGIEQAVHDFPVIPTNGFKSIQEFIIESKSKNLSHIVTDGKDDRPAFLNDIFFHEEKYPFLTKEYDSSQDGFKYYVKIFRINYDLIEQ